MFDFSFGKKTYLGIDIGDSTLKIAELEIKNGKANLTNYAWAHIPDMEKVRNGSSQDSFSEAFLGSMKKILAKAKFKSKDAYVAIPSFGGLITLINFPRMPEKDMEQAIRFEAHKYIPTSLDDVVLSWDIIENGDPSAAGKNAAEGEKSQVLLVAASKIEIQAYEKLIKAAGLNLQGMEIENISMTESLIGKDRGSFIILDIGARICNIIYVNQGIIKANRNLDAGGTDFTKAISNSMGITIERAEAMKLSNYNFFGLESSVHIPVVDLILAEVLRIANAVSKDNANFQIDAVILSGGTALMTGFKEFVADQLKMKVIVGNPLSRIEYDRKLEPVLDRMKTEFSVSLGLALKGVNNYLERNKK
jgi:type IV pilus assembly protein PilM